MIENLEARLSTHQERQFEDLDRFLLDNIDTAKFSPHSQSQ